VSSSERIAQGSTLLIVFVQVLNAVVAVVVGSCSDRLLIAGLCLLSAFLNVFIDRSMTDYEAIKNTMEQAFKQLYPDQPSSGE
jgi:hypothetical protein